MPVDNLMAKPVLCNYLRKKSARRQDRHRLAGRRRRASRRNLCKAAQSFARHRLQAPSRTRRSRSHRTSSATLPGDRGVVDDMISTGGTLVEGSRSDQRKRGDRRVYLASHGIFAGEAIEELEESQIEGSSSLIRSRCKRHGHKSSCFRSRRSFADAINRITTNRSVSELFAGEEPPGPFLKRSRRSGCSRLTPSFIKVAVANKEFTLAVEHRTKLGTTGAQALRAAGKLPAVLFGHGVASRARRRQRPRVRGRDPSRRS